MANAFTKQTWTWASVPGLYKPSRWIASQLGGYSVNLVAVAPTQASYKGAVPKTETLRLRAPSLEELREKILEAFPNAAFSNTDPSDLKTQYAAQRKIEADHKRAIEEEQRFVTSVVDEMRRETRTWDAAKQEQFRNLQFTSLADPNEYPEWHRFFSARPGFISWPGDSYENRSRILKYCEQHGYWPVPTPTELATAINALLTDNCLHLQSGYKRSENVIKDGVRDYVRASEQPRVTEQVMQEAVRRISGRFGMPVSISIERLQACGFGDLSEELFAALQARYNPDAQGAGNKNSVDLKSGLSKMRRDARGGPLSRDAALSGY